MYLTRFDETATFDYFFQTPQMTLGDIFPLLDPEERAYDGINPMCVKPARHMNISWG